MIDAQILKRQELLLNLFCKERYILTNNQFHIVKSLCITIWLVRLVETFAEIRGLEKIHYFRPHFLIDFHFPVITLTAEMATVCQFGFNFLLSSCDSIYVFFGCEVFPLLTKVSTQESTDTSGNNLRDNY